MYKSRQEPSEVLDLGNKSEVVLAIAGKVGVVADEKRDTHDARIKQGSQDHKAPVIIETAEEIEGRRGGLSWHSVAPIRKMLMYDAHCRHVNISPKDTS